MSLCADSRGEKYNYCGGNGIFAKRHDGFDTEPSFSLLINTVSTLIYRSPFASKIRNKKKLVALNVLFSISYKPVNPKVKKVHWFILMCFSATPIRSELLLGNLKIKKVAATDFPRRPSLYIVHYPAAAPIVHYTLYIVHC